MACKAEAKGKKIKWLSRRKYVNNCVTEAMKGHPTVDVTTLLRDHPDLNGSSGRALARILVDEAMHEANEWASFRAPDQAANLFRRCKRQEIRERLAIFRRSDALLGHFGSWRVGIGAEFKQL